MAQKCSAKDWLLLRKPKKESHKGDNGRLLIFAGSRQYHGSLIFAILAAVRFCDLVYVYCDKQNRTLVQRLKSATPSIIVLGKKGLKKFWKICDAFLMGPGWEDDAANRRLLLNAIKSKKPVVLDATALKMIKPNKLHQNVLITPHSGEFYALFGMKPTKRSVILAAKKYKCTILCKGPKDLIASPSLFKYNLVHHVGMTKGGSGDVLAGLAAALVASHNSLFRSACAAAYLNGLAGIRLSKKMGNYYSALDLANELPFAAKSIEK